MSVLELKEEVRERDGHRCTECGMGGDEHKAVYGRKLDVHRVIPGSDYTLDGCVTVCKGCHAKKPKRPAGTYPDRREGVEILYAEIATDVKAHLMASAAANGLTMTAFLARHLTATLDRRHMPSGCKIVDGILVKSA